MTSFSISDANYQLQELISQSERGETIEITRHGTPIAIMVSALEYQRLIGQINQGWLTTLRKKYEFDKYGLTDEEAATLFQRDRSSGRDFKFDE